jgi:hypothetical protein
MQCLLIKHLQRGEGFAEISKDGYVDSYEEIDIVDIQCSPTDPEGPINYIKVSALSRIYAQMMQALHQSALSDMPNHKTESL